MDAADLVDDVAQQVAAPMRFWTPLKHAWRSLRAGRRRWNWSACADKRTGRRPSCRLGSVVSSLIDEGEQFVAGDASGLAAQSRQR